MPRLPAYSSGIEYYEKKRYCHNGPIVIAVEILTLPVELCISMESSEKFSGELINVGMKDARPLKGCDLIGVLVGVLIAYSIENHITYIHTYHTMTNKRTSKIGEFN